MAPALPIHPTLTHPRTGQPLRAVFVSEKSGRVFWPVIGAADPPAPPAPPEPPSPPAPPAPPADDKGFPDGTPIERMTGEQREAYWKHQARRHEERNRAYGGLTPEQLKDLQEKAAKHDELQLELGTTAEQAAARAAKEAKDATRAELEPALISAKLDAAAARAGVSEADLTEALEFVSDKKIFLAADGSLDADKVSKFISKITKIEPVKGNPPPKGPTVKGHGTGSGSGTAPLSGLSGSELYDRLHPKKPA